VWSLGSPTPNFTLEGHDKGVNSVEYFTGGDKPYLISGADDKYLSWHSDYLANHVFGYLGRSRCGITKIRPVYKP